MNRLARGAHCTVLSFLVLIFSSDALMAQPSADPKDARREANRYFAEGYRAIARDDYEAARRAFEKSYALSPEPDTLRNLGASQIQSGHALDGARNLSRFLAEATNLDKADTDELRTLLGEAEAQLGRLECSTDVSGASIIIDEKIVGMSPLPTVYHVSPGEHSIRAEKEGYVPVEARASTRAGELVRLQLVLRPVEQRAALAPNVAASSQSEPQRVAGAPGRESTAPQSLVNRSTVTIGLAVLTVGTAAVAYGFHRAGAEAEDDASAARDRLMSMYGSGACARGTAPSVACGSLNDKIESSDRSYKYSNVARVGAVAFGLGTVAAFVFWPKSEASGERPTVASWVTPNSGGLSVSSAF